MSRRKPLTARRLCAVAEGFLFFMLVSTLPGSFVCSGSSVSSCSPMEVPDDSTAQVQVLTYPDSSDSQSCTGSEVTTKLQSGEVAKITGETITLTCCEFGNSVIVEEGGGDPYVAATGNCTTFRSDPDSNPVQFLCELSTERRISIVKDGRESCNDMNPEMILPTYEGCMSVGSVSYLFACDGYAIDYSLFASTSCEEDELVTSATLQIGCNSEQIDGSIDLVFSDCSPSRDTDTRDLIILGVCLGIVMIVIFAVAIFCGLKAYDRWKFNRKMSLLDMEKPTL